MRFTEPEGSFHNSPSSVPIPSHINSVYLILTSHLCLELRRAYFLQLLGPKVTCVSPLFLTFYIPLTSYPFVWQRLQIMKLLIIHYLQPLLASSVLGPNILSAGRQTPYRKQYQFESNIYGFRPGRSCHDAIGAIFNALGRKTAFVLEAFSKC
jgi:hypothetical protein